MPNGHSAAGCCCTRLDGQHCPLRTYHGIYFKDRVTLWEHNTVFISDEYERVKYKLIFSMLWRISVAGLAVSIPFSALHPLPSGGSLDYSRYERKFSSFRCKHWKVQNNKIPEQIRHGLDTWMSCAYIVLFWLLHLYLKLSTEKRTYLSTIWWAFGVLIFLLEPNWPKEESFVGLFYCENSKGGNVCIDFC